MSTLARRLVVSAAVFAAAMPVATLQLHRDPKLARQRLPIYRMLDATTDQLEQRARSINPRELASIIRGTGTAQD